MGLDAEQAVDEINGAIKEIWDAEARTTLNLGYDPELTYEMLIGKDAQKVNREKAWARITLRHTGTSRRAIGGRRSENYGTVWINIFVPQKDYEDATLVSRLADKLSKGLRRHARTHQSGSVDFRNTTMLEVGEDGPQYVITVKSDFAYEQIN